MPTIDQTQLLQMRSSILSQNSALQKASGSAAPAVTSGGDASGAGISSDFSKTMQDAVQSVSAQQKKASALSAAYERGDTNDVVQVMVERQKASIGFEATLQVRNKLLSAYRDIMNMPV